MYEQPNANKHKKREACPKASPQNITRTKHLNPRLIYGLNFIKQDKTNQKPPNPNKLSQKILSPVSGPPKDSLTKKAPLRSASFESFPTSLRTYSLW